MATEIEIVDAARKVVLFTEQLYQPGYNSNKFAWALRVLNEAIRLESESQEHFTVVNG